MAGLDPYLMNGPDQAVACTVGRRGAEARPWDLAGGGLRSEKEEKKMREERERVQRPDEDGEGAMELRPVVGKVERGARLWRKPVPAVRGEERRRRGGGNLGDAGGGPAGVRAAAMVGWQARPATMEAWPAVKKKEGKGGSVQGGARLGRRLGGLWMEEEATEERGSSGNGRRAVV